MSILAPADREIWRRVVRPIAPWDRIVCCWAAWMAVVAAAFAQPPSSPELAGQRPTTIRLVVPCAYDEGEVVIAVRKESEKSIPVESGESSPIRQTSCLEATTSTESPRVERSGRPSETSIAIVTPEPSQAAQQRPSTHTSAVGDSPISRPPTLNSTAGRSLDPATGKSTFHGVPGRLTPPSITPKSLRQAAPASNEERMLDVEMPVEVGQRKTWTAKQNTLSRPVLPDNVRLLARRLSRPTQTGPDTPVPGPSIPRPELDAATGREQPPAAVSQSAPRATQTPRRRIAATPVSEEPVRLGRFEVIDHTEELTVVYRRSKLLRTDVDVYRTAVVDASVCEVVQYTPREISVIGHGQGATHLTFWFEDGSYRPVTYLVKVVPDPEVQERREEQFGLLEEHLAELFPESKVELLVLADKLVVKGQARDAEEATQIMALIRGQAIHGRDIVEGKAALPFQREETNRALEPIQVINMLQIPGVHQVALRVKIAELNRTAARSVGVDLDMNFSQGELLLRSLVNAASGGTASILGSFDGGDLEFGIHYLEEHGVMRMLSEPTLVTLSGRPATFIAGGEFAVPTTVGVGGAAAVTTDFRAYGAIISFLPVVLDKDHIRLEVAPEFSQINEDNAVNGTPGLDTRAVTTTVEMREGQTLAIAGLLDDSMSADKEGDLPWISQIFGRRNVTRNETELIILVTPELMHPMEPEEVPPLPGFDVTEPTNCEFFLKGHLEGRPTQDYRSTVWPHLRRRYQAGGPEMISGPFGHGE